MSEDIEIVVSAPLKVAAALWQAALVVLCGLCCRNGRRFAPAGGLPRHGRQVRVRALVARRIGRWPNHGRGPRRSGGLARMAGRLSARPRPPRTLRPCVRLGRQPLPDVAPCARRRGGYRRERRMRRTWRCVRRGVRRLARPCHVLHAVLDGLLGYAASALTALAAPSWSGPLSPQRVRSPLGLLRVLTGAKHGFFYFDGQARRRNAEGRRRVDLRVVRAWL